MSFISKEWFSILQSIDATSDVIPQQQNKKIQSHLIILTDTGEFCKSQHLLMIRMRQRVERILQQQQQKAAYENHTANILNDGKLTTFSQKSGHEKILS